MLRKMYLNPADNLHDSPFMSREPTAVSKRKHRETVKKRNPYAGAIKIRKHHPYEEWLKMRHKMDEAELRKRLRRMHLQIFNSGEAYRAR